MTRRTVKPIKQSPHWRQALTRLATDYPMLADERRSGRGLWTPVGMKEIEIPLELIRSSQVLDDLVEWRAEEPPTYRGGAKSTITDLHVLVAAIVLALEKSPLHLKMMRDVLAYRLDDEAREHLGVPPKPDDKLDPIAAKNWNNNTTYAAKKIIKIMDPYADLDRRQPTTREQRAAFRARLDNDPRRRNLERRRKERLDKFSNAFLEATFQTMNRDTRRALTKTGLTVDQTPVPAAGRLGRSRLVDGIERKNPKVLEPEMGWYYKRPDDREQRPVEGGGRGKDTSSSVWGAAANLAILTAEINGERVPPIAIGFSLSTPLVDSEGELVKLAKSVIDRGHKPAHITADREYFAGKSVEKLHEPVRELGFDVVTDYKRDMLGVKGGHAGSVQIEGRHYCPGMGPDLMNASVDAEAGLLDQETYIQRIEKRKAFELRAKERPDENGKQPMMCPAHGPQARVVCSLRERHPKSSSKPKEKVLATNVPVAIDGQLPAVCSQTSVTFNGDEGLKHKQVLRFGSEEWAETYNVDRNISEGYNSFIKDTSHEALEERGGRRMRGLAAQQFLATFLVISANLRAIYTFVHDRYLAEAYGVTKNRPVHVSEYARHWFTKPDDIPAGTQPGQPLRT